MVEKLADKLRERASQKEIEFKSFDQTTAQEPVREIVEEKPTPVENASIGSSSSESENIELKVVRPESFAEVSTIADYLLAGCTVVLNVEALDRPMTLRMLDFLNGVTYSTDGEIKKVAQTTYIVTSRNVDVTDAQ